MGWPSMEGCKVDRPQRQWTARLIDRMCRAQCATCLLAGSKHMAISTLCVLSAWQSSRMRCSRACSSGASTILLISCMRCGASSAFMAHTGCLCRQPCAFAAGGKVCEAALICHLVARIVNSSEGDRLITSSSRSRGKPAFSPTGWLIARCGIAHMLHKLYP